MKKTFQTFGYALSGLATVFKEEKNFKIECLLGLFALLAAYILNFSLFEYIAVVLCIVIVITAEIINTAIEDLCDKVEPNIDPAIGKIKDMMAAFVLVASLGSLVVWLVLFYNHFV